MRTRQIGTCKSCAVFCADAGASNAVQGLGEVVSFHRVFLDLIKENWEEGSSDRKNEMQYVMDLRAKLH